MAEERLNDLNKDKKYRIKKNADGEDELFIDESYQEDEEEAEFEVPEFAYDDEDAATMTPEQLYAAIEERKMEEQKRMELAQEFTQKAKKAIEDGDYSSACKYAEEGLVNDGKSPALSALRLRALTLDFTNFNEVERCADAADLVAENCSLEDRKGLSEYSKKSLDGLVEKMRAEVASLSDKNESGKLKRRSVFVSNLKVAKSRFICSFIPFMLSVVVAIVFASIMFSRTDGLFMTLAISFAAVAVTTLILSVVFLRGFVNAKRKVKYNESDKSTKIGRKYLNEKAKLLMLERIYTAINPKN